MNFISKLCSLTNVGKKGGRDFILNYLSENGNYHKKLKVIHVTGTCGKGSTSSMIAKGLQDAGFKVGLFTSPHLIKLNERLKIDSVDISDNELNRLIEKWMEKIPNLSFSEYLTFIMIDYFLQYKVDYVVCEVFVGGEFDSTNVFDSIVSVLTNVGMDHVGIIGNTYEEILEDKLGIARQGRPFFTRIDNIIVKELCDVVGADLKLINDLEKTNLLGDFQQENAALAREVLLFLGLNMESIKKSLNTVSWQGRIQFIEKNIMLDCTHNELGVKALIKYISELNFKKFFFLFAMSKNKNFDDFSQILDLGDEIVYCKPNMFRIEDPTKYTKNNFKIINSSIEGFEYLKNKLDDNTLLVICGSCYLVAEILDYYKV